MRGIILILIFVFSFSLANAQIDFWYYCNSPSSPFQNCKVLQEFKSIVAGSVSCSRIYFDNEATFKLPLIIRINYTAPPGYEIWRGDISGYGWIYSERGKYNKSLICEQPKVEFFFDEKFEVPNNTLYCYNKEELFVLGGQTDNIITICLRPNIALLPTTFNFTVELLSTLGSIESESSNITQRRGASIPRFNLEVFTNFDEPISIKTTSYTNIFIKEYPKDKPSLIQFVEISTNATEEQIGRGIKVRVYYNQNYLKLNKLNEKDLTPYYFSMKENKWIKIPSALNLEKKYIEFKLTQRLILLGLFSSPIPICGNGICETNETCSNCPEDCSCPSGYSCENGTCTLAQTGAEITGFSIFPIPYGVGISVLAVLTFLIVILLLLWIKKKWIFRG